MITTGPLANPDTFQSVVKVSALGNFQDYLSALLFLVRFPAGAKSLVSHTWWILKGVCARMWSSRQGCVSLAIQNCDFQILSSGRQPEPSISKLDSWCPPWTYPNSCFRDFGPLYISCPEELLGCLTEAAENNET
ncbi:hypothetical protein K1719_007226 [Acacia pycnantha]|nr:hypothetical protein K1719_007226 [Acacia pycnantha]